MRRLHRSRTLLALAALLSLAACVDQLDDTPTAAPPSRESQAVGPRGSLLWFGYAGEDTLTQSASLAGTRSYVNWGHVILNSDRNSDYATRRIDTLAAHSQMALVELGPLLWKDTTKLGEPSRVLYTDYRQRWDAWRIRNSAVLNSGRVIGFQIADEPHHNRINMAAWDTAATMVKQTFPWAAIVMIEASVAVDRADKWDIAAVVKTVDWVGLDQYAIHPATDALFLRARDKVRLRYPGKRWVYVGDGWYGGGHVAAGLTLTDGMNGMGQIMREWYEVAAADPAAILLGVFIWPTFNEGTGSRDFPPAVLAAHTEVGRAVTGRTRPQTTLPVGVLDSISSAGVVTGWACDPDGAWGEAVLVDVYVDGALRATVAADQANQPNGVIAACRSGLFHRFRAVVTAGPTQRVTAAARDLNTGSTTLPWAQVYWVQPAYASWGTPNTLTVAGLAGNGTGGVQITWRDRTASGPWTTPSFAPVPSATDGSWSNTLASNNYCHDYEVYARYAGFRSRTFTYAAATAGFCTNRLLWIQTQQRTGFGPVGSLVVSGNLSGAPAGSGVQMYWRNVTLNGAWTPGPYVSTTDANGTWYNHIANADSTQRYAVFSRYDGGVQSATCTYFANSGRSTC
jgi:hypothetical protein